MAVKQSNKKYHKFDQLIRFWAVYKRKDRAKKERNRLLKGLWNELWRNRERRSLQNRVNHVQKTMSRRFRNINQWQIIITSTFNAKSVCFWIAWPSIAVINTNFSWLKNMVTSTSVVHEKVKTSRISGYKRVLILAA